MIRNISSCQYDQVGGAGGGEGGDGGGGGFPTKQTRTIFFFYLLVVFYFFFLFQSKLENQLTHTLSAGQDRHCTVIHD